VDTEALRAALQREARNELWRRGEIAAMKCDENQLGLYALILACTFDFFVLECARRLGKSFLLLIIAIEVCLRKRRARVVYGAQTIKNVAGLLVPIVEAICEDAPADCKPKFDGQAGEYRFPNGSVIVLFGCDDQHAADRGRGPGADLVIVDEAGFIPILFYVLSSVLNPQTLTTGGRTLIASTPSPEPDHDFTKLAETAEKNGAHARRTIYDNPRLTKERIQRYIANEAAIHGMTVEEYLVSDAFKREFLALRAIDKSLTVMGDDWEKYGERSMAEAAQLERPQFFDAYGSLDMGGVDPHALLFGYWHFQRGALVIEDELLLRDNENTQQIAERAKEKERERWGEREYAGTLRGAAEWEELPDWLLSARGDAPRQPYLRVCDNDIQIAKDLHQLHGISFIPTAKDEKWHRINELRVMLRQGRILIHPRCRNLERHLRTTMWLNERRKDYRRKNGEHGDLLDALVYMVRNVNQTRNPVPDGWGVDPNNQVDTRKLYAPGNAEADAFAQLFGMKRTA
jgi:hypothetical protein